MERNISDLQLQMQDTERNEKMMQTMQDKLREDLEKKLEETVKQKENEKEKLRTDNE